MMDSVVKDKADSSRGPKRRQNRSCDHCRRGKRGCDVQVDMRSESILRLCSNCKKWKKECTIEWLRTRERRLGRCMQGDRSRTPATEQGAQPDLRFVQMDQPWDSTECTLGTLNQPTTTNDQASQIDSLTGSRQTSWAPISPMSMLENTTFVGASSVHGHHSLGHQFRPHSSRSSSHIIDSERSTFGTQTLRPLSQSADSTEPTDCPIRAREDNEYAQDYQNDADDHKAAEAGRRLVVHASSGPQTHAFDRMNPMFKPNASNVSHLLSQDFNRVHIKAGLLKIYHDSLEGALSCWLTERNCPYSVSAFDGRNVWSRTWANRMFARISALDNAYIKGGFLPLRDQQQASKVLNAVVMAFSAQWSHTAASDASVKQPTTTSATDQLPDHSTASARPMGQGTFDRTVQSSLWHGARRALLEASDNTSFKVIFAGIIFSLTQRPVDASELADSMNASDHDDLAPLFRLLDLDGPTITLDAALRKLQDHQRNLRQAKYPGPHARKAPAQLSTVDQETFGLLYWLANMFDSISATMNGRSFTISDADTQRVRHPVDSTVRHSLHATQNTLPNTSPDQINGCLYMIDTADLWGNFFMNKRSLVGDIRKQRVRWPCSYLDAAAALTDAAPVKVLLYRRVGQLQGLFYQNASPQLVERGLETVLEVYNHWYESYGLFIGDCIKHHEKLPVRVQSWYTLLAGHWNLAVLILADLMDTLENAGMTMPFQRDLRASMGLTSSIRENAVIAISDLGYNSRCSKGPLSFQQSDDFHYAVNQAALLTEPWTVVLVRAFSRAGAILAERVKAEKPTSDTMYGETDCEPRRRLQCCIDALLVLGRKSDMAKCAATVLQRAVA